MRKTESAGENLRTIPSAICLAGPTGSGKTSFAVKLAEMIGAEIINADSRQVYREFPIITAQPAWQERKGIPHHLYGFLSIKEIIDSSAWARMASAKAAEIRARGSIPILVGGTGFYFKTLLEGIAAIPPVPAAVAQTVRARLDREGANALYNELLEIDAEYAGKIHKNDRQRITRALEVFIATGKPLSFWHRQQNRKPFCAGPLLVLDFSLSRLEPRLKKRIDGMIEAGAIDEARNALAFCPDTGAPGWNGIGCREMARLITGRASLEDCCMEWWKNTRAYAKRQLTWFHGRKNAIFVNPEELPQTVDLIKAWLP